jgi:uncharacterized protein
MKTMTLFISILFFSAMTHAHAETSLHELKIHNHVFKVEIVRTPQERARGLMYRDSLPENQGMLFVFETEQRSSFWMKNTCIPLSVAFIDRNGKILEIRSMKPFDETPIVSQSNQVLYALETNLGWFADHKIKPGSIIQNLPK